MTIADIVNCDERGASELEKPPATDGLADIGAGLTYQGLDGQSDGASGDLTSPVAPPAPVSTTVPVADCVAMYEAARHALTEAERIADVKDIHDKAVAWGEWARRAKDTEEIERGVDIRLRAGRRAGEMLIEMKARGQRDDGKGNRNPSLKSRTGTPKLDDLGITKSQSSQWQRLAKLLPDEFEAGVNRAKKKALSAVDRTIKPAGAKPCANPRRGSDLRHVQRAVKILCAARSAQELAAAASPTFISRGDLARAIEFLEELQTALGTSEHFPA